MTITPEQTAEALEGSIEAWKSRVAGELTGVTISNCPLCTAFIVNPGCNGCPVATITGGGCTNTPCSDYDNLWANTEEELNEEAKAVLIEAAQAEVDFLKSLRKAEPKISPPITTEWK